MQKALFRKLIFYESFSALTCRDDRKLPCHLYPFVYSTSHIIEFGGNRIGNFLFDLTCVNMY